METSKGVRGSWVSASDRRLMRGLYKSGLSVSAIARQLKVNRKTVTGALLLDGVQIVRRGSGRLYSVRDDAFDTLTPAACYWAGFLFADGYIGRSDGVRLALSIKDAAQIEKFKAFVGSDAPVKNYSVTTAFGGVKAFPVTSVRVHSVTLENRLRGLGMIRKSTDRVAARQLADSPHFWRGLVDGDGVLGLYPSEKGKGHHAHFGVIASPPMIKQFCQYSKMNCGVTPRIHLGPLPMNTAIVRGRAAIVVIRELYAGSKMSSAPSLDRKLAKAKAILDFYKNKPPENKYKTHCPRGHEYSEANTYTSEGRGGGTQRACKSCTIAAGKINRRLRQQKLKEKGQPIGFRTC
jgi:hypothetical protein